ncbi:MAG: hypothetical protein ABEH56_08555 [Salinirussus sp.]
MRTNQLVTIALVVASAAALPAVGLAATDGGAVAQTEANETTNETRTNATVAPGERLTGVIGIQGAELEGEVEGRAFGLRIARAATNASKADVLADQLGDAEDRLRELRERKRSLDAARENGTIGEGEYRARVAELAARTETVERLTERTNRTASGLPADLLESKGINATAIQRLKNDAATLTGPEVAEIARSIAGRGVGGPPGQAGPPADRGDRPDDAGPPENETRGPPENETRGPPENETRGPPDNESREGGTDSDDSGEGTDNDGDESSGEGDSSGKSGAQGKNGGSDGNGSENKSNNGNGGGR